MPLQRSMSEPPQRTSEVVKNALPWKLLRLKNPTQDESYEEPELRRRELINKVPSFLRREIQNLQFYEPLLVSLGPYCILRNEKMADKILHSNDFKIKTLELFIADSGKDVECFYSMVLALVDYARTCYVEYSTDGYDDPTFAQMMLLDASFIINFIVLHLDADRLDITHQNYPGEFVYAVLWRDLLLLENQIPFRVLKDLILLGYGVQKGQEMLRSFLSLNILGVSRQEHWKSASNDDEQPAHLLDAFWSIIVSDRSHDPALTKSPEILSSGFRFLKRVGSGLMSSFKTHTRRRSESLPIANPDRKDCKNEDYGEPEWVKNMKIYLPSYRTVTDLKEKGIHFRPQSGHINAIKFHSGYLSAHVEVPTLHIFEYTKVVVLNMIAHELICTTNRVFAEYIDFMASLIDSGKDVKELREKKILFTTLKSDDEVAILCKEIYQLGWKNGHILDKVKEDIQAHYDSYGKTWLAELKNTYFRTPWTIVALLAATLLIVLTFLQTYYTMK